LAIYEITEQSIRALPETTFSVAGLSERGDLQRLLRTNIQIISPNRSTPYTSAPDLLVISEEFGDCEDSRRRIDLLAIDSDANLVVIELKRT